MALAIVPTTQMQEILHYFAQHVLSLGLTYPCQEMNHLMMIIRTPSWKYTQSFVIDGNFKAKHLHPIKPFGEIWLSDGLGFMVGKDRYKKNLVEAADTVENQAAIITRRSIKQMQFSTSWSPQIFRKVKGKPNTPLDVHEQMNMDYTLYEAAQHNMEGITRAVTFYDVNCQYNKHFWVWVD
ncbi:hypothetical protein EDB19DRAFT_1827105 [Suillus lakei]|nr:hypothetical protein EDB19DRAFT_1827105 [Suillus lakei]